VIASYTGESRVRAERHNGAGKELMLTNPGWSKSLCTTANLWSVVDADRTMFAGTFCIGPAGDACRRNTSAMPRARELHNRIAQELIAGK
jgi:hypothetical protein